MGVMDGGMLSRARRIPRPWRRGALGLLGLALYQLGALVAAPGLDGRVLGEYLRAQRAAGGGGLLALYDRLAGGGLSRGAPLALGVMPYLSAWTFVRLARYAVPAVARVAEREGGGHALRRWTRALTVLLALVQSLGYALFTRSVPGAVAEPGVGHVVRTVLVLTAGALAVMWLGEGLTGDMPDDEREPRVLAAPPPDIDAAVLGAAARPRTTHRSG